MNCVYVMVGGALGALARYGISLLCSSIRILSLPLGTISVNIAGCFILGLLTGLGTRCNSIPPQLLLMLTTGFCGAFTTFSTFSAETVKAFESGHAFHAIIYIAVSIAAGIAVFILGKHLTS